MDAVNGNKLRQNKDVGAIFGVMNNAKQSDSVVVAWKFQNGTKITSELRIRVIRKFRNELEFTPLPNNKAKLDRIISGNEAINFYLPDQAAIFQAKIKTYGKLSSYTDQDVLKVSFPVMVAQIDRRKDLRLLLSEENNINILFQKHLMLQKIQSQTFKKSCFDISAGGCSFIVSQSEKKFFELSDTLDKIVILMGEHRYVVAGTIVNIIKIDPGQYKHLMYGGHKVCIQFTKISKQTQEDIRMFVFRNIELDTATA